MMFNCRRFWQLNFVSPNYGSSPKRFRQGTGLRGHPDYGDTKFNYANHRIIKHHVPVIPVILAFSPREIAMGKSVTYVIEFILALVSHIAEIVGMVLLALMVLVVSYTCFTRYVLGFTSAWSEELALMCMVWFGFMAIALGVRDDGHIGVTLFDKFYPRPLLRFLNLFKYVAVGAFGVFMAVQGYNMAMVGSWNKLPGMGISSYWMYIIVAASGVAIVVYCLEKLFIHATGKHGAPLDGEGK